MLTKTKRGTVLLVMSMAVMMVHWGAASQPVQAQLASEVIYADALGDGWSAYGSASYNLEAISPVHEGTHAISVNPASHQFLRLQRGGLYTHGYTDLRFWIHGGAQGGQSLDIYALDSYGLPKSRVALSDYVTVPAGRWEMVEIPLADLEAAETLVTGFGWQESSGNDPLALYLDDISLAANSSPNAPQILSWTVDPWAIPADGQTQTVITAQVSDFQGDLSRVTLDLSALGGSIQAALFDNGHHNDGAAGDGTFGLITTAAATAEPGETPLILTAIDREGNQVSRYLGTLVILTPLTTPWPPSLPQHLGWGTGEVDWQGGTGLPWDYLSYYLAWHWQGPNPDAVYDLTQSAWDQGYVPVFTFEFLLPAASCEGMGSPECMLVHLLDPVIMQGYFDRLVAAAQQAAGDQPVIFHLEPDVAAVLQRHTVAHDGENGLVADDPDTIPAWAGDPAYPNTYPGAVQRMVDLIHQNGPNVLVALHARMWAAGGGIDAGNDASLNVDEFAWRTAHFLTTAGGPQLDLIFVSWKTHDAGSGLSPWLDDTNLTWPNFNRVLYWDNRLAYHSAKPLVLWRLPAGNRDLENTCQRYQDNRIDYAFTHSRDLLDAGVRAIVVNGGGECRTSPLTDDGNVQAKTTIYYATPTTPAGLVASITHVPGQVAVSWSPGSEFDLWGYRVYCGRTVDELLPCLDAGRRSSVYVNQLAVGEWVLSVAAYDARGIESPLAPAVTVNVVEEPQTFGVYLPLVNHAGP